MSNSVIYSYFGVNNPNYAIQIYSGNYIVSDYGNGRIIELDSMLSGIIRSHSVSGVSFFDYSEENETLLVSYEDNDLIQEITWSDIDIGTVIWQSTISLNSPHSATYKQEDSSKIVIADTGNNRISIYDRNNNEYIFISRYNINSGDVYPPQISMLYRPYIARQYSNGNICIVEKEGRPINFSIIESSSSSSSSSMDSSSSSSST